MFDYANISKDKITMLEEEEIGPRAVAGLMTIHGIQTGILSIGEGLDHLNNILVSIAVTVPDEDSA